MDTLTRLNIQQQCADIVARYALAVNTCNPEAYANLYTEDAIWQRPNVAALHGRDAIYQFIASELIGQSRVLHHVNGTVLIDVEDDSHASGWSQTTVYTVCEQDSALPVVGTTPDMIVEYRDQYRLVDDAWYIARRDTTIVFIKDEQRAKQLRGESPQ